MSQSKGSMLRKLIIIIPPLLLAFAFYMYQVNKYLDTIKDQGFRMGIVSILTFIISLSLISLLSKELYIPVLYTIPPVLWYIGCGIRYINYAEIISRNWGRLMFLVGEGLLFYAYTIILIISIAVLLIKAVVRKKQK